MNDDNGEIAKSRLVFNFNHALKNETVTLASFNRDASINM